MDNFVFGYSCIGSRYVSFNTYKLPTDERIKVINELKQTSERFEKKGYCCYYEHLPPEAKREATQS
jgi:hypothetical protein